MNCADRLARQLVRFGMSLLSEGLEKTINEILTGDKEEIAIPASRPAERNVQIEIQHAG
jgi:hypothetical protein